jgi:hypothetical protein
LSRVCAAVMVAASEYPAPNGCERYLRGGDVVRLRRCDHS